MSRVVAAAAVAAALLTGHTGVNLRRLRVPPTGPSASVPRVSVLVPARDEATRIDACVRALLAQRDVELELLVLDDQSTDGTAGLAAAAGHGDPRLRVLAGAPLPPGWLGKPHACAQLAAAASHGILVFVDADVVVVPQGVAATAALLRDGGLDLVSPYPRQIAGSAAERLVQPLLQWSWLTFLPLGAAERWRAPSLTAANGQLLACDAGAYRRAGGHGAVRREVIEDIALARAFKRSGARVGMADGTAVAECRMYEGWSQLRDGYTKSLWAAFGSVPGAVAAWALLAWLYLLPPAALVAGLWAGRSGLAATGAAGYLAAVTGRVLVARRTAGRPADALAHPASVALLGALGVRSVAHRAGGRLRWKGRSLALAGSA